MKIKLIDVGDGSGLLWLPLEVVEALGWKTGDEVVIDIPTTHDSLIVHKTDVPPFRTCE